MVKNKYFFDLHLNIRVMMLGFGRLSVQHLEN
jgi:hypothetical protein